jgi:hypothetical protein
MKTLPTKFYFDQTTHVPLKVDLFTRIHEMEGITQQLVSVDNMPGQEKELWLDEHESYLRQLLEQFADRLPVELEESKMDSQTMQLLFEYTTRLQEMVAVVQSMLNLKQKIKV